MAENGKRRIVFTFVEAGLGHIMPMTAVYDTFKEKYGDKAEVVRSDFFKEGDENLKFVEDELIKEVKKHNKYKGRGAAQFLLMDLVGQKLSLDFLMKVRYRRGFKPAMKLLKSLDADVIFCTHFFALYYALEARKKGVIKKETKIYAYCPDPVIGKQWDRRSDCIFVSGEMGKNKAKNGYFKKTDIEFVPFLLRRDVLKIDKSKEYYREKFNLPKDNFTVLLADGAYGAGKLKETTERLIKSDKKMTVISVCGKNEELFEYFKTLTPSDSVTFKPFGFTDKILELTAASDLFIGKAGASSLAEPTYFGVPQIVNFRATPIEKWICAHHVEVLKTAVLIENVEKIVETAEKWTEKPEEFTALCENCEKASESDGAVILADKLFESLKTE